MPTVEQVGYIPSSTQKDALAGTSGTPSTSNPYATKETTDAISASISGFSSINRSFTAGGDIEANDSVYLSASNTVKQMNASAFTQAAATALVAGTGRKQFPYSNTLMMEIV